MKFQQMFGDQQNYMKMSIIKQLSYIPRVHNLPALQIKLMTSNGSFQNKK